MANLNQSPVSPKAFPLQPGDSGVSLGSQQRRKAAWHRTAVKMAAWVEIIVGASFLLVPNAQSQLIFGATPEGIGDIWARFAGIALIGLGVACMPSNLAGTRQGAVRGLIVFNIGATIFFAWVAVATTFRGVVLWPVVILHAVITIALVPQYLNKDSVVS
jgi:hypothetical protein